MKAKQVYLLADGLLSTLENALAGVASIVLLVIMFTTAADVFLRYVMNQPLSWAFDLMTLYLILSVFFLSFSYTLRRGEHLAVTFFSDRMPAWCTRWFTGPLQLLGVLLFIITAYLSGQEAYHAWSRGYVVSGIIEWPTWIPSAIVTASLLPLSLRLFLMACDSIFSLPGEPEK